MAAYRSAAIKFAYGRGILLFTERPRVRMWASMSWGVEVGQLNKSVKAKGLEGLDRRLGRGLLLNLYE